MPLKIERSVLDEDDMATDSDEGLATQQSIKAYADALSSVSGDFSIGGDLSLLGNDIKDSNGNVVISFDGAGNIDIIGPVTYASTTIEDMIVNSGTITFNNQGAGTDPILDANNAAQILDLTGALVASGDITCGGNVWVEGSTVILDAPAVLSTRTTGSNISIQSTIVWNNGATLILYDSSAGFSFVYDGVVIGSLNSIGNLQIDGNLTAANIITAGLVDGVDLSAWLDQSVKIAASPTFVGLTLSGAIATPTTITTSGNITCGGNLLMAAAQTVDCKTNGAYLKPRYISQALIPTPNADELLVWIDTDTNVVSLVYNDATSGVVSIALG